MSEFADRLIQILNHGSLNLALGMGYRLGVFEVLDQLDAPATAAELAQKTGLSARYLEEWLGIMVTGNIVDIRETHSGQPTFSLPKSHADLLCIRAGSDNLGVYTQEIPLLTACAMEGVLDGFKTGKGVPFSQYPEFQAFMSELSNAKHRKTLIQEFLPSVDQGTLVTDLEKGIRVCDLGCGQGVALILMARAYPRSWFLGIDSHAGAIDAARAAAQEAGLANIEFEVTDAASIEGRLKYHHRFDYVCAFDAIHDQAHPLKALKSIRYMLGPGSRFSMIDIKAGSQIQDNMDHPMAPFLYTVSLMHCMPVGLNDTGRGLGMMWGKKQALDLLKQAGFEDVSAQEIPNDSFNLHFFCRI